MYIQKKKKERERKAFKRKGEIYVKDKNKRLKPVLLPNKVPLENETTVLICCCCSLPMEAPLDSQSNGTLLRDLKGEARTTGLQYTVELKP